MTTEIYRGVIRLGTHGDADDILYLQEDDEKDWGADYSGPLAEAVSDAIKEHGSYLSVQYWTASRRCPDEDMKIGALREMLGAGDADFGHRYSDITGYLWTDEEIDVGGHDLLAELGAQAGRYCLLEITYSTAPPEEEKKG